MFSKLVVWALHLDLRASTMGGTNTHLYHPIWYIPIVEINGTYIFKKKVLIDVPQKGKTSFSRGDERAAHIISCVWARVRKSRRKRVRWGDNTWQPFTFLFFNYFFLCFLFLFSIDCSRCFFFICLIFLVNFSISF